MSNEVDISKRLKEQEQEISNLKHNLTVGNEKELRQQELSTYLRLVAENQQINLSRTELYIQKKEWQLWHSVFLFLIFLVGYIVVVVVFTIMQVRQTYMQLIGFVESAKWTQCSGLSIALSLQFPWYAKMFGCAGVGNENFPAALAYGVYNPAYFKIIDSYTPDKKSDFLDSLAATATEMRGSAQYDNPKAIACIAIGCQYTHGCPQELQSMCFEPCLLPSYALPEMWQTVVQSAMGGAATGAAVNMSMNMMKHKAEEQAAKAAQAVGRDLEAEAKEGGEGGGGGGAIIVATTALSIVSGLYTRQAQGKNNCATCWKDTEACFLPPGVDCSSLAASCPNPWGD